MFWNNLVNLCNQQNTTPTAVVKALGIAIGSVTKWKSGVIPRDTTLRKIADHFNVTVESLLSEQTVGKNNAKGIRIPVLGNVAAGIPVEAITDIEDYEEITGLAYQAA